MCLNLWRPMIDTGCLYLPLFILYFHTSFSLNLIQLGWLARKHLGSICLHLISAGLSCMCDCTQIFTWGLGIELMTS